MDERLCLALRAHLCRQTLLLLYRAYDGSEAAGAASYTGCVLVHGARLAAELAGKVSARVLDILLNPTGF